MDCTHDKTHDRLTFATLKHLVGQLDAELTRAGVKSKPKRESICGSFLFQAAYFLDNQWVELGEHRYRVGLCFQEVDADVASPTRAIITDYENGEMLHEAALGIAEAHFNSDNSVVPSFLTIGEVYDAT
jgi:hypothetical protein